MQYNQQDNCALMPGVTITQKSLRRWGWPTLQACPGLRAPGHLVLKHWKSQPNGTSWSHWKTRGYASAEESTQHGAPQVLKSHVQNRMSFSLQLACSTFIRTSSWGLHNNQVDAQWPKRKGSPQPSSWHLTPPSRARPSASGTPQPEVPCSHKDRPRQLPSSLSPQCATWPDASELRLQRSDWQHDLLALSLWDCHVFCFLLLFSFCKEHRCWRQFPFLAPPPISCDLRETV